MAEIGVSKVNKAANTKRVFKGAERALRLRAELWPKVPESDLWSRLNNTGFTTIPRTLPALMNLIDSLSKNQPAGRAYLALWFRAFDQALIIVENPTTLAAESGFTGERATTTWRQRMATLAEFGFIKAHKGSSGDFHYLLLMNPHKVVWKLKEKGQIPQQLFLPLLDRATEIGAYDMSAPDEARADDAAGPVAGEDVDAGPDKVAKPEDFPVIEPVAPAATKPASPPAPAAKALPKKPFKPVKLQSRKK
jgi:hypothetical protein